MKLQTAHNELPLFLIKDMNQLKNKFTYNQSKTKTLVARGSIDREIARGRRGAARAARSPLKIIETKQHQQATRDYDLEAGGGRKSEAPEQGASAATAIVPGKGSMQSKRHVYVSCVSHVMRLELELLPQV